MTPPGQSDRKAGARWAPALRALGDERLVRLAAAGSDPAFAAIYGRYAPLLHGYCRSLLHDEEEAGDALQNAMLKALQALRRSAPAGPLRPWLFRIAHNESISLLRARSRRPGELSEDVVAGAADAHRHAAAREDLARLLSDLEGLTAHQRGAIVMRELGGLSYDDVASALETSPLAARQAVFAARRKLTAKASFGLLLPPVPLSAGAFFAAAAGGGGGAALAGGAAAGSGGLLGGLFGGTMTKAVAGVLATASVGVGSVEVARHVPPVPQQDAAEQRAQVEVAQPTPEPRASVTATATPAHRAAAIADVRVPARKVSDSSGGNRANAPAERTDTTPSRKVSARPRSDSGDDDAGDRGDGAGRPSPGSGRVPERAGSGSGSGWNGGGQRPSGGDGRGGTGTGSGAGDAARGGWSGSGVRGSWGRGYDDSQPGSGSGVAVAATPAPTATSVPTAAPTPVDTVIPEPTPAATAD